MYYSDKLASIHQVHWKFKGENAVWDVWIHHREIVAAAGPYIWVAEGYTMNSQTHVVSRW